MIRAVLFDMDGVLLDTETLGLQAMTQIARELKHPIDRAFYLTTLGVPNAECGHVYRNALGQDFPYEVAMKRFQQYFFDYNRTRSLPRKPGLMDCLTGLRQRGLRQPYSLGRCQSSRHASGQYGAHAHTHHADGLPNRRDAAAQKAE